MEELEIMEPNKYLEFNQFFNTNIFGFGFDYFFSSSWLYYGFIVITIIFLLIFLSVLEEDKNKKNKKKSEFEKPNYIIESWFESGVFAVISTYLGILLVVSIILLANWSMEADQVEVTEMNDSILNLDFKNHVHNEQALNAYNYYVNDKKIKSWEFKAFQKGLTVLNVEDVKYRAEEKINKKGESK